MKQSVDRMQVLVVEDNAGDADLVSEYLDIGGLTHEAVTARTLGEAIAAVEQCLPEIIVLDLGLPDAGGVESFRRMHAAAPDLPIVVMTGLDDDETALAALKAGAQDYLVKGHFRPESLVRVLRYAVERCRLQRQAEQERNRTQQYLDLAGVALVALDADGLVTMVNRRGCQVLEGSEAEILGSRWFERFFSAETRERLQPFEQAIQDGDPVAIKRVECPVLGCTGKERIVAWHNVPLLDGDGAVMGILCSGEDVTEQRAAEAELQRVQEQLLQSQKMEAIGRLAGGVAHDFNNLLTVILNYTNLIAESLDEADPMRTDVREIEQAGERASDLTMQLLAFSRKQIVTPRVINLNEVMEQSERMLKRLIGEDIELSFSFGQDLKPVEMDPGQMNQILVNLAVNARDAMPYGGKLTFLTSNVVCDRQYAAGDQSPTSGPHVLLVVSDSGQGMDRETLSRIFEPFYTTKEESRGTGLGLATVYGIVRHGHGSIEVTSEVGRGTTFRIYLPVTERAAEEPACAPVTNEATGRGETVLLIEDDSSVRKLAKRVLESSRYRVLEAAHPGEALVIARQHPARIDLILSDVIMPNMNGMECYRQLSEIIPGVKVLFMSGYPANAIADRGVMKAGAHLLQKPFTVEALKQNVRAVLDG